jgi:LAGLIDADG-like domain
MEELENNNLIYSYILGLYLGDGYINKMKKTYRMRIFLDKKYPTLIEFVKNKLSKLFSKNKIGIVNGIGCVSISVYNNSLPLIFPQHGFGRKHNRKIELTKYQLEIIDWNQLLKGLFHSDGCYYKDRGKDYFNFTNVSEDIVNIFKMCCDKNKILYTQSINKKSKKITIRISRRDDVNNFKKIVETKEIMAP